MLANFAIQVCFLYHNRRMDETKLAWSTWRSKRAHVGFCAKLVSEVGDGWSRITRSYAFSWPYLYWLRSPLSHRTFTHPDEVIFVTVPSVPPPWSPARNSEKKRLMVYPKPSLDLYALAYQRDVPLSRVLLLQVDLYMIAVALLWGQSYESKPRSLGD